MLFFVVSRVFSLDEWGWVHEGSTRRGFPAASNSTHATGYEATTDATRYGTTAYATRYEAASHAAWNATAWNGPKAAPWNAAYATRNGPNATWNAAYATRNGPEGNAADATRNVPNAAHTTRHGSAYATGYEATAPRFSPNAAWNATDAARNVGDV